MGMIVVTDDLDTDPWDTKISVHSPAYKVTANGNYTTYQVSLRSNNSCFSLMSSLVYRRYSEFVHLRNLLKEQHPNMEPPHLPPKKLFKRFDQDFVGDRTEGLQNFLKEVLSVTVYLSSKAVHLFLQSNCSMAEIDRQVNGKEVSTLSADCCSDTSSDQGDNNPIHEFTDDAEAHNDDCNKEIDEIGTDAMDLIPKSDDKENTFPRMGRYLTKQLSQPIPILQPYLRASIAGSAPIFSSPNLSPSNSSGDSIGTPRKNVSFCNKVKVAVIRENKWNIDTRPIRTCKW